MSIRKICSIFYESNPNQENKSFWQNLTLSIFLHSFRSFSSLLHCHNMILQTGWLKQQINFLIVMEPGSPRLRCQQDWFLARAFFLAYSWMSSCYVPTRPLLCAHGRREISGVSTHFTKIFPIGLGPHLYELINLNCLLKALSPNLIRWGNKAST